MIQTNSPKTKKSSEEIYAESEGVFKKWLFEERVLADQALHASTKLVIVELLHRHNIPDDRCDFISERKLAKKLRLALSTVHLAIAEAKKVGCLKSNQPARFERNQYTFDWDWMPSEDMDTRVKRPRKEKPEAPNITVSESSTVSVSESSTAVYRNPAHTVSESVWQEDTESPYGELDTDKGYTQARAALGRDTHKASNLKEATGGTHATAGEQSTVPLSHWHAAGSHADAEGSSSLLGAAGQKSSPSTGENQPRREPAASAGSPNPSDRRPAAPKKSKRKKGELSPEQETYFARLLAAYPPNNGSDVVARGIFLKKLKAGADPEAIIAGAGQFAHSQRFQELRYVTHLKTWLDREQWTEAKLPPPVDPALERIRNSKNPITESIIESMRQENLKKFMPPKPELKLIGDAS